MFFVSFLYEQNVVCLYKVIFFKWQNRFALTFDICDFKYITGAADQILQRYSKRGHINTQGNDEKKYLA